jgi:tetratricopeptide (TPR) repeat protein
MQDGTDEARVLADRQLHADAISLRIRSIELSELGRHEEALAASEEEVALLRRLTEAHPEIITPGLAASTSDLSDRLRKLGRADLALAAENAEAEIRRLDAAQPAAFMSDLATSLSDLSCDLLDMGRRKEALAASGEAVAIFRSLARAQPEACLPGLGAALINQSNQLG